MNAVSTYLGHPDEYQGAVDIEQYPSCFGDVPQNATPLLLLLPEECHSSDVLNIKIEKPCTHLHILSLTASSAEVCITINTDSPVVHLDIEAHVASNANLTVCFMQHQGTKMQIRQRALVEERGAIRWQNFTFGAQELRHELISEIVGPHAESSIDWALYAKGEERQTVSVRNDFAASEGGGEIMIRGVAQDKAQLQCNGMIAIQEDGGDTNAYLTEEVLMLDSSAKVDAIPALEIKTDNVRASHSASVARISEEDVFYFGARGIAEPEARNLIVKGFLGDVICRFPKESLAQTNLHTMVE